MTPPRGSSEKPGNPEPKQDNGSKGSGTSSNSRVIPRLARYMPSLLMKVSYPKERRLKMLEQSIQKEAGKDSDNRKSIDSLIRLGRTLSSDERIDIYQKILESLSSKDHEGVVRLIVSIELHLRKNELANFPAGAVRVNEVFRTLGLSKSKDY
jgi:hypothetical protein